MLQNTPVDQYPEIVNELRQSFNSGITRSLEFRKQQLRRVWDLLDENVDVFIKTIHQDLRKPVQEVLGTEIGPSKEEAYYLINNLDRLAKPEKVKGRYLVNAMETKYYRKDALGLILIMSSWNYPVQLIFLPLVGAIATGNVAIIKPAELSPHTAVAITELLPRYLDPRFFRVVNGGIPETTALLQQRFDHIFYTGNGHVGRVILAAAAKHLTPVTLELGGKSPAIVMPDSDLQVVANRVAFGRFLNCGQVCVAVDYVLVHEKVLEPFVEALKKATTSFYGTDPQQSKDYARIIYERSFARLTSMLANTTGRVVYGGQSDKKDLFIAPTIVTGFTDLPNEPLMQEEIFGPILPVIPISDVDEALQFVNASSHIPPSLLPEETTHCPSIFSRTTKKSLRKVIISDNFVLDNTHSGGVTVNDIFMHAQELAMCFGGVGPSGMGKYHGDASYDVFTHRRAVMVKNQGLEAVVAAIKYPPYSQNSVDILNLFTVSMPSWKGLGAKVAYAMTGLKAIMNVVFGKK
ncbi:Aldehyde/histidinol dehydrogenase [Jimgerdemannia flammicorona]|uniref:Aldehyde dehydrogenase n=1 Tax=Jimgerdemannia flammicorona TaxID=994334 RepID=A0A433Q4J0_9FUNG|nr:Aldehyde/histidinol dehydrogenase [Jimgerdemannia flammicorona]